MPEGEEKQSEEKEEQRSGENEGGQSSGEEGGQPTQGTETPNEDGEVKRLRKEASDRRRENKDLKARVASQEERLARFEAVLKGSDPDAEPDQKFKQLEEQNHKAKQALVKAEAMKHLSTLGVRYADLAIDSLVARGLFEDATVDMEKLTVEGVEALVHEFAEAYPDLFGKGQTQKVGVPSNKQAADTGKPTSLEQYAALLTKEQRDAALKGDVRDPELAVLRYAWIASQRDGYSFPEPQAKQRA